MTEQFKEQIKSYPHPLYYNSNGNRNAYKLSIPHLSFALQQKRAFMAGSFLYPKEPLHLVDLEKENIKIVTNKIELIPLQ